MSEELKSRVDTLATLMDQYKLGEAELQGQGWKVSIKRIVVPGVSTPLMPSQAPTEGIYEEESEEELQPDAPVGMPISSPMNGIYYASSSPSSPPFVKEGDTVNAGQVVALIEAMKVFNEINAPMSGTIRKIAAQSGNVVGQGEPLMYIG